MELIPQLLFLPSDAAAERSQSRKQNVKGSCARMIGLRRAVGGTG
jgi:hypothetical protein